MLEVILIIILLPIAVAVLLFTTAILLNIWQFVLAGIIWLIALALWWGNPAYKGWAIGLFITGCLIWTSKEILDEGK